MGSRKQNFYNNLVKRYGFEEAAEEIQDLYLDGKKAEAGEAIPDELIDPVSLCGPRDVVRERIAAFRDAGVGTLMVTPMAFTAEERIEQLRRGGRAGGLSGERRPGRPLRFFLGAFGQPGHAFPMLALGAELAARGHEVTYETWSRWREPVEAHGMRFVAAPEYPDVPHPRAAAGALRGGGAGHRRHAARDRRGRARRGRARHPHAGAGAGRRARGHPGGDADPPRVPGRRSRAFRRTRSARGCRGPRSARTLWRAFDRPVAAGLRRGRDELNDARRQLGLGPVQRFHGGLSQELCLVGTFPQLEYPRALAGARARRRAADVGAAVRAGAAAAGRRAAGAGGALDGAGPRAPAAARGARRAGRRAGAGAGDLEPPAAARAGRRCRPTPGWSSGSPTRRRCPAARWSSATPATARWCARWPAAARCWPSPTPATWPRTPPGSTGPAPACGCRGRC